MNALRVGVVGAGTMGVGIAYVSAVARCETWVAEPDPDRADELMNVLETQARRGVERGKLTPAGADDVLTSVHRADSVDALPEGLDVLIESVPERMSLKCEVLSAAERRRPMLLASNTSSFSIGALAGSLERPGDFLGMHFFNPVWSLRLVELVRGELTRDAAVERASGFVEQIGKQSILALDLPGFATTRLDLSLALEGMRLLEDGVASADDIDRAAVVAYRHPVGPLRLSDIVGLDVRLDTAEHLSSVYGERYAPPQILRRMVSEGRLGQKSGRGFFDWRAPS